MAEVILQEHVSVLYRVLRAHEDEGHVTWPEVNIKYGELSARVAT